MEAATQLGCWSWPTLDPATLAAQFGTTQCFQGPPPSMPVTSKKDIKVESPEAALPEQDTEEMHLRSKRLSARSASAINISMSSASSPRRISVLEIVTKNMKTMMKVQAVQKWEEKERKPEIPMHVSDIEPCIKDVLLTVQIEESQDHCLLLPKGSKFKNLISYEGLS